MEATEIDWRDAPDWANYHAIDGDGDGGWYRYEPSLYLDVWIPDEGEWSYSGYFITDNPETSLTKRP